MGKIQLNAIFRMIDAASAIVNISKHEMARFLQNATAGQLTCFAPPQFTLKSLLIQSDLCVVYAGKMPKKLDGHLTSSGGSIRAFHVF
jgi:hypothetical protein